MKVNRIRRIVRDIRDGVCGTPERVDGRGRNWKEQEIDRKKKYGKTCNVPPL
jgi:hypothetical protein